MVEEWTPVSAGVFQRRYDPIDVSIVVILGRDGLLLVDTLSSPAEADAVIDDVAARFSVPIRWVANTHAHYDHTFGNQSFGPESALDVPIYGHAGIREHFAEFEAPRLAAYLADPTREPNRDWHTVSLTPPTHDIRERMSVDIGGRVVELIPLPPGHTDTDIALFVPDERVWILGDIVEESGPPMFGSGSYPLGWPGVLESLLEEIQPGDAVIPGHGRVVDRDFVEGQAAGLRLVADRITDAFARRLGPAVALGEHDDWPFPTDQLVFAFEHGLARLGEAGTA